MDETGVRVPNTRQWLPAASTELLTIYAYHRKQGFQVMDAMQILPRFRGVMVHDFWSPYFQCLSCHAICDAHIIRELKRLPLNWRYSILLRKINWQSKSNKRYMRAINVILDEINELGTEDQEYVFNIIKNRLRDKKRVSHMYLAEYKFRLAAIPNS